MNSPNPNDSRPADRPEDARQGRVGGRRTKGLRPAVEAVEARLLLSTFQVVNNADSGAGSLRQAILDSNTDSTQPNTITFKLPAQELAITPQSPLPALTTPVTIDGTSQTGYGGTPLVELIGSAADPVGLTVTGGGSTIQGLSIDKFTTGIVLNGLGGDRILGDQIGLGTGAGNATGLVVSSPDAVIGGTSGGASNQIVNNQTGIIVAGPASAGTVITGNQITGNSGTGVHAITANNLTIGGSAAGAGNTISANGVGVQFDASNVNLVAFNTITNNKAQGVGVLNADRDTILSNSVTGNQGPGIDLDPTGSTPANGQQQPPNLVSLADAGGGQKTVSGTFQGAPGQSGYVLQFFGNPETSGSGSVQGMTFLGQQTIATDNTGKGTFLFTYTPVANEPTLSATVTDPNGNTSRFSTQGPPPGLQMPPAQTMNQGGSLVFSSANHDAIKVSDPGVANNPTLQVTLAASNGGLTLSGLSGLSGNGNGTGTLVYNGPVDALNAALNGLTFTPSVTFNGSATLSVSVNDLAVPELGGPQTVAASTPIGVTPFTAAPSVTPATTTVNTQTTSGLVVTPAPNGLAGISAFKVTGISNGSLYLADGTTPVASGSYITVAQGAAGLRFTPAHNFAGAGAFTVQASLSGDDSGLVGSPASASVVVNRQASTTGMTASPGTATVGTPITLTATVAPASATGVVQFFDGQTALGTGTLANGVATYTASSLSQGTHTLWAAYAGDTTTAESHSPGLSELIGPVSKVQTTTALAANANPATAGQSVTFTANVSPAGAGGVVTLSEGGNTLGHITLQNGTGTFSTTSLPAGSHAIVATYSGDEQHTPSTSATLTEVVNPAGAAATTTALAVSPNPSVTGQPVTLSATVAAGQAGAPSGSVQFFDGSHSLGSAPVANGVATLTTPSLTPGAHSLSATYAGDTSFAPSTSTSVAQVVKAAATTTALSLSSAATTAGQPVTFTATLAAVSPGAGAPAGAVHFVEGTTVLGDGTQTAPGVYTFTTTSLAAGSHAITAVYDGSPGYAASSSTAANLTVSAATASASPTTTALMSSASTANVGDSVTFTANVGPGSPGGTVAFLDGTTLLGTSPVASGSAQLKTSSLTVGSHVITAAYSGDASHLASLSSPLAETVNSPGTVGAQGTPSGAGSSTVLHVRFAGARRKHSGYLLQAQAFAADGSTITGGAIQLVGPRGRGPVLSLTRGVVRKQVEIPKSGIISARALFMGSGSAPASQSTAVPLTGRGN